MNLVERAKILENGTVAELILIFGLHHGGPLSAQQLDGIVDVDVVLVAHALECNAQCDEHARSANARTAVHRDRTGLAELFLGAVHNTDQVDDGIA